MELTIKKRSNGMVENKKKPELLIIGLDGVCPSYVKEAVARGELPGFARLMEQGVFFDNCMPAFPSITPTCWTAIASGSVPSVNGALCQSVHVTGTDPFDYITPYSSINVHAERFWETAAKKGKQSLLIDVPCSGPARCEEVLQVLGGVTTTPDKDPSETYISGIPQQFFKNDDLGVRTVDTVKILGGIWEEIKGDSNYIKLGNNAYQFYPVYNDKRYRADEVEKHFWIVITEVDGVRVGADLESAKQCPVIHQGEWSEIITRRLMTDDGMRVPFHFRARVDSFDELTQTFIVFITASRNLYKEITPLSLAREIAEIPQTFNSDFTSLQGKNCSIQKFFEGEYHAIDWKERVVSRCVETYEPEIVFDYYCHIDTLNHRFRSAFEKVHMSYEGEYETACEAYQRGYELVDKHVNWMLDHVKGENTTVALISDHGSIGNSESVNPWIVLEKAGLLVYTENSAPRDWKNHNINWSKTKAYPIGSCYINVNLQGREPCGAVDANDYDHVVMEIIDALQTYARSHDGENIALAFAVEKEQAGFIGHGGENCGDVVYGLAGSHVGGYYGGVHSHQIPSARSKTGDIRSLCLIKGPKFKEGVILSRPIDLTDFAPTLCFALGYPQPKDATGGIVFQAYKDGECN